MIELGPRGTGKSYFFSEFSPYSTLISGGQATKAILFYNNARQRIGLVGFWDTVIGESDELVYICAYDDLAHRQRAWSAFMADPEWQAAKKATEANGPLVERVVNKIWKPTSFSPMQ